MPLSPVGNCSGCDRLPLHGICYAVVELAHLFVLQVPTIGAEGHKKVLLYSIADLGCVCVAKASVDERFKTACLVLLPFLTEPIATLRKAVRPSVLFEAFQTVCDLLPQLFLRHSLAASAGGAAHLREHLCTACQDGGIVRVLLHLLITQVLSSRQDIRLEENHCIRNGFHLVHQRAHLQSRSRLWELLVHFHAPYLRQCTHVI